MEIFLRLLQLIVRVIHQLINPLILYFRPNKCDASRIPPIKNRILTLTLNQVIEKLQKRECTSQDLVQIYIQRIKEVNPHINAMVQDCFRDALDNAVSFDKMITTQTQDELKRLYQNKPLLGVPFTVKEACGVRGMKHVVGSLNRLEKQSPTDGEVIALLREAGAIPLLVSANPEFCFSIETNPHTHGRCLNAYDSSRTSGGSSGGEGALNGCGASLFGIGSDIAGSIRIPCMFNGVFGHKPTGGITSIRGHFPSSDDLSCLKMLQMGPISRFATDLPLIMRVIADRNAHLLHDAVDVKRIKIYYAFGFTGINGLLHQPVESEIQNAILKAVNFFEQSGLKTELFNTNCFDDSLEISLSAIARLKNFPYLINAFRGSKILETLIQFLRSCVYQTDYTKEGLVFELMRRTNAFMFPGKLIKYEAEATVLKNELIKILKDNGVLLFPTFHTSAFPHGTSLLPLWGIDYTLLFNVLELPSTHVPMGVNKQGLPIGFQVIAAPFKDQLCLEIAKELEKGFGGWIPPTEHIFKD